MDFYSVKKLAPRKKISVRVPASKSLLNRALLLAAFSEGDTHLLCGTYGEDTEAMLGCLASLGILVEKTERGLLVHGGVIKPCAELDVMSAGTVARFLPITLAFRGGEYTFLSSEQMQARPMDILALLAEAGVEIEYLAKAGHFPFRMRSKGIDVNFMTVNTDKSTQYASGVLLAAALGKTPFTLRLTGGRRDGSYINMTIKLLRDFGAECVREGDDITVHPLTVSPAEFAVEPDVSGACYFYALSLLCGAEVLVEGVHSDTCQGDHALLELLRQKGVRIADTPKGIVADGRFIPAYNGFDENLKNFSDQAMTVAALALFASSPSILRNLAHIRGQECDRINAIVENINALGARSFTNGNDIFIEPAPLSGGTVKTFNDHRVAMAFALVGLKTGNITIENPACCRKTFAGFFDILDAITK